MPSLSRIKVSRNKELIERYYAGEAAPDLARDYGISEQRVYQVIAGKRK